MFIFYVKYDDIYEIELCPGLTIISFSNVSIKIYIFLIVLAAHPSLSVHSIFKSLQFF